MKQKLTLEYVAVTLAHLRDDVENMIECNKTFWHEEMLSEQLDRAFTTIFLLDDLVDELKRGAE